MRAGIPILALALALGACATPAPPPPPAPDLAAEEAAIRKQDSVWLAAAAARDAAGEAAVFAEDGVAYRGQSEPLAGPAAYQAFQTKYYADNPKSVTTWTTRSITVASSGDMAVQTGAYSEAGVGPKGTGTNNGNFLTHWKKVNGQWKVAADMSSPNEAARTTP
jgi:uncharacterized protein (TIGR02246 family)